MKKAMTAGVSGVVTAAALVAIAGSGPEGSRTPRMISPYAALAADMSAFQGGSVAPNHVKLVMSDIGPDFIPAGDDSDYYLRNVRIQACYDPENPPSAEIMAWMEENLYAGGFTNGGWSDNYNVGTRWSPGSQGDPYTVTWSFVPDGLSIPSGVGEPTAPSVLFARMDTRWARATWIGYFQNCFDRWAQVSGMNYVRVTSGGNDWDDGSSWGTSGNDTTRGDVRISAHPIDGLSGILAYNSFPQNGDMVLDSNDMSGSSNFFQTTNQARFLRNVVQHEHGHGLGFNHVCPSNSSKLMEPFISVSYDGVRHDDIRASQRQYGDVNEPDNSAAAAGTTLTLGTINVGSNVTLGAVPAPLTGTSPANSSLLSIDANGEQDYHKFTVGATPVLVNVTVTPLGQNYASYTQDSACSNTTLNTNSLQMGDLAVQVIDKNTTTVLAEASAAALGSAESVTSVLVSSAGDFYVRVYESASQTQSQLYSLNVTGAAAATLTATDGTFNDRVRLNWTAIPNAGTYSVKRNTTNNLGAASTIATGIAGLTFDDTTAVGNQTYFYWVTTTQGAGTDRPISNPDSGFRTGQVAPGPFSLSAPADSSVGVSLTPTLSWTSSSDATSYTVVIDDDASLSSPILTQAGVAGTSFNVPGGTLVKCSTYYWGVTAVNGAGSTASTPASWSFETKRPADFDGSGFVDVEDYAAFVAAFEAGDESADFDGSTFVDIEDFSAFVTAFEAGC
ncbi:MAG TPA: matrixin family metalloprotease [Phycisphaerales bacterium]|nr:matrixin family metalloprotease [Phycisphaerales bacterium]